jgi:hypothetical protein
MKTSVPIRSFLMSDAAGRVLKGKRFTAFVVCRRYWSFNLHAVKKLGVAQGGQYVDGTHWAFAGGQIKSLLSLLSFLGKGHDEERYLGVKIPPTNLQADNLDEARTFAAGLVDLLSATQAALNAARWRTRAYVPSAATRPARAPHGSASKCPAAANHAPYTIRALAALIERASPAIGRARQGSCALDFLTSAAAAPRLAGQETSRGLESAAASGAKRDALSRRASGVPLVGSVSLSGESRGCTRLRTCEREVTRVSGHD